MRKVLGLVALGTVLVSSSAKAEQPLSVVYPPADHQTTANQIFLIGTAPPQGKVLVNGKAIERSQAGHFAPSFPLQVGENLFTLRYQNQQVQIKVNRLPTIEPPPIGLAFGKDSLTPAVDIARVPGEVICFGATAPINAQVNVRLGDRTIPLLPQFQNVQLPPNSAALTQQDRPATESVAGKYQGCTTALQPAVVQPEFQLTLNGKTTKQLGTGKVTILSPLQLEIAEVTAESGVARTGASTDHSRLTPLPKGTQAAITGREGEWLRLDYGGWINSKETRIYKGAVPPTSIIRSIRARQVAGATEVAFPLQLPVPVSVQQGDRTFTLTLYNTTAQTDIIRLDDDPLISRLDWQQVAPNRVQYTFNLKTAQQWGYKLRYDGTSLVLSLRHPPRKQGRRGAGAQGRRGVGKQGSRGAGEQGSRGEKSLSGIRILLDPGHGGEELGSKGPTGYPEKDINLLVSQLVRQKLVAKGATVYMTREEDKDVSLPERVAIIDKLEPAIAVSIHYNALPDGGDAMRTQGIAAFWYNTQAHSLALFMHNYLVNKLKRPSYGVYWNNLALTRPTSAPSVLLELGFMINPTEFEWITNKQEQQKLANAIADGITLWLNQAQ